MGTLPPLTIPIQLNVAYALHNLGNHGNSLEATNWVKFLIFYIKTVGPSIILSTDRGINFRPPQYNSMRRFFKVIFAASSPESFVHIISS